MTTFEQTTASLCDRIEYLLEKLAAYPKQRIMIALAGVPGSGKSTVCAAVLKALSCRGIEDISVVPMVCNIQSYSNSILTPFQDGFHYPKSVLSAFEDPALAFQKRGAPFTFDAAAFLKLVVTLYKTPVTTTDETEIIVRVPSFDHAKQDPIADDIKISSRHRIIIIEGNYTLLNEPPWDSISEIVHDRSVEISLEC